MGYVEFYGGFITLLALIAGVSSPPGVTQSKQSLRCHDDLKFPINRSCDTSFLIGNQPFARVKGSFESVIWPFQFFKDEGVMQLLECRNFTQRSLCAVDEVNEKEEIIDYQIEPLAKKLDSPGAAASIQGCFFSVLLAAALTIVLFG